MPHGWAIAEVHLLLRDSLLFEDAERLVLFAGVPEAWFTAKEGMELIGMPTHFGPVTVKYQVSKEKAASLTFDGNVKARDGIVLRFPKALGAKFAADGAPLERLESGDVVIPSATKRVDIRFE
jgi:hypothetical protein